VDLTVVTVDENNVSTTGGNPTSAIQSSLDVFLTVHHELTIY